MLQQINPIVENSITVEQADYWPEQVLASPNLKHNYIHWKRISTTTVNNSSHFLDQTAEMNKDWTFSGPFAEAHQGTALVSGGDHWILLSELAIPNTYGDQCNSRSCSRSKSPQHLHQLAPKKWCKFIYADIVYLRSQSCLFLILLLRKPWTGTYWSYWS